MVDEITRGWMVVTLTERAKLHTRIESLRKRIEQEKQKRAESKEKFKLLTTPEKTEQIKMATAKWKTACQKAIQLLQKKEQGLTVGQIISCFGLNPVQLEYNKDSDSFL